MKRKCGACSACCTALAVKELGKGDFVPCSHLRKGALRKHGACKVYAERPESCQKWSCAWVLGIGEELLRPDRSGVILDIVDSEPMTGFVIRLWEMRPGAVREPAVQDLLASLCEHPKPVIAIRFEKNGARTLIGGNEEGVRIAKTIAELQIQILP